MIDLTGPHYATFNDLHAIPESLLNEMEAFSDRYLSIALSNEVWPSEYPWPLDSLRTNTRLWEYPFVLSAINKYAPNKCKVLDIGSALTFFPYYLVSSGYEVVFTDVDERMVSWSEKIKEALNKNGLLSATNNRMQYLIQDVLEPLKITDQVDIVTNISVLEHIPTNMLPKAIDNVYDILNKDGVFICTMDVLVRGKTVYGHHPLNTKELHDFLNGISSRFDVLGDYSITAPIDLITNKKYPPSPNKSPFILPKTNQTTLKRRLVNAINGYKGIKRNDTLEWTAYGCIFRKK